MEISIWTILIGVVLIVALIKVLSEFAANAIRAVIFVALGLIGVYVLVVYSPNLITWLNGLIR